MTLSFFLPILTYPEPTPAVPFGAALDLVATLGGNAHVMVVETDLIAPGDPLLNLTLQAEAISREAEDASRRAGVERATTIRMLSSRLGIAVGIDTLRVRLGLAGPKVASAARVHDFALLCLGNDQDHQDMAQDILFASGGPAIVLPSDGPAHLTKVAVAWDNSRTAARALRDAMPILALAKSVIVLSANFDKPIDPRSIDGVLALLRGHGVNASAETIASSTAGTIGGALQDAALTHDCGLLVMGAYGHSRLHELILGGATRSLLLDRRIAVLMSH